MKKKWMVLVVAALVLTLVPVGRALATTITLDLHNNDAPICAPGTEGCPNDGTYWHFVIAPDNDWATFVQVHLNLGTSFYDTSLWIQPQVDQVYVAVPTGFHYDDLLVSGSTATVTYAGDLPKNAKFVLSHVCVASQVPEPSSLLLLGSGILGLGLIRRRRRA
ncbi:MAG TPA: PEP-CTERM sorting domain-containing protein [bacterium]